MRKIKLLDFGPARPKEVNTAVGTIVVRQLNTAASRKDTIIHGKFLKTKYIIAYHFFIC